MLKHRCQAKYFNPRSREGSDPFRNAPAAHHPVISIHAPAKGATEMHLRAGGRVSISIHAPAKGATRRVSCSTRYRRFQSTLPRRERLVFLRHIQDTCSFQSTLPRRERQLPPTRATAGSRISIHAPAKGATRCGCSDKLFKCHFNPRSREGSDEMDHHDCPMIDISIHAPAKGATCISSFTAHSLADFNPRSREGSDHDC